MTVRKGGEIGRKLLPEDVAEGAKQLLSTPAEKASYHSFEEAVANSEQLQTRPPIEVSDSGLGSETYLTQPFQHLSWYPR